MFGLDPSSSAKKTINIFKEYQISDVVELGAGLGRDSIYFGKNSINTLALDYSNRGVEIINKKIIKYNLSSFVTVKNFDIRKTLPFKNNSISACYSHMLYCMALTRHDLQKLNNEVFRILKPGGLNIYTVRNTEDGDFKRGKYIGEDMYENDGFIVHFFSIKKIKSLLNGFKNIRIDKFEEGKFPRKLFYVVNQKKN